MSDEKKYTLAEARQKIAEETCNRWGHTSLNDLFAGGQVVSIFCSDCGATYVPKTTA